MIEINSSLSSKLESDSDRTPVFAFLPKKIYTSSDMEEIETKELSNISFFAIFLALVDALIITISFKFK